MNIPVYTAFDLASDRKTEPEAGIPDRVSIDPESPYFFSDYKSIGVRFNGQVRQNDVEEFCVSEGWIRKRLTNARGQLIRERGKVRTLKMRGTVRPFWR